MISIFLQRFNTNIVINNYIGKHNYNCLLIFVKKIFLQKGHLFGLM